MTMRFPVLIVSLLFLWAPAASAWRPALAKDVEPKFVELIRHVEAGKLGPKFKTANVSIDREAVLVVLLGRDGSRQPFVLLQSSNARGSIQSKYFAIEPGEGATAGQARILARELDALVQSDPWRESMPLLELSAQGGHPEEHRRPTWQRASSSDVLVEQLLPRFMGDVGPTYVVAVVVLLGVVVLGFLITLWRAPVPLAARDEESAKRRVGE